jgi:hypothetical protein
MKNKQTAVEWLALYIKGITNLNCDEVIEQAKAMEREQIIEAYVDAQDISDGYEGPSDYYNKEYGGNNLAEPR